MGNKVRVHPNSRLFLGRDLALVLLILLLTLPTLRAQAEHPITGRKIAPVMSVAGAEWLDREERDREELPDRALDLIGISRGIHVADVGAGTGFLTIRMARRAGPDGLVYANDVQPGMLDRIRERTQQAGLKNVQTILGSQSDPRLPSDSVDLVVLCDVYHEFSQPQAMMRRIRAALKADGRLAMLEYKKEDPGIPIRDEHKMSIHDVRAEVEAEGFRLISVDDSLPRQHVFLFKKSVQ